MDQGADCQGDHLKGDGRGPSLAGILARMGSTACMGSKAPVHAIIDACLLALEVSLTTFWKKPPVSHMHPSSLLWHLTLIEKAAVAAKFALPIVLWPMFAWSWRSAGLFYRRLALELCWHMHCM
mmetsp:Transcript_98226/g.305838  ORF Transcript_98226/g.305838 Transcript_98226/m.305838 type:complete len:124 (-) Transcript_98226:21-392(-)